MSEKYDYCPVKTSFCALLVSVFLVTVTYSSCHEPDRIFFFFLWGSLFFLLLAPQILPPTHPPIKSERLPGSLFEQTHFPSTDTQIWERNFNHISTIREVFLCCRGSLFKDSISLPSERDYRTAHLPWRDLPTAKQPAPAKTDLFWGAFKQTIEAC